MANSPQRIGSASPDVGTPTAAPDRAALLEAHVSFELDRWRGEHLDATLQGELDALFDWLSTVTVGEVLPAGQTAELAADMVADVKVTDELVGGLLEAWRAMQDATAESELTFGDLVELDDVQELVNVAVEMPELRRRSIEALTDNPAYHELVAHVLYHGVKAFVLSENVIARRVPGAQSLIKFGQRSINTAVPGLEEGVDRRLQRFVQGQIGETLSESRRFIEHYFTSGAAHEFVDAIFESQGGARLGEVGDVISEDEAEALTAAITPMVEHLVRSGVAGRLVAPTIERVLTAYEDRTVTTLLEEFGVDRATMTAWLIDAARPVAAQAVDGGYLEGRLRERLGAFYADPLAGIETERLTTEERRQLAELLDKLVR